MKINIVEITIKVRISEESERKHENILGTASITLKEDESGYFTICGFTIWKSKHGGLNVTVPQNRAFKYLQFEPGLWNRVKKAIIDGYEMARIPIVE